MSFARIVDEPPDHELLQVMAILRRPQHPEELAIAQDAEIPVPLLDVVALRGLRFAHHGRLRILPGARGGVPWLAVLSDLGDALSLVCSRGIDDLRRPRLPTAATGVRIYDVVPDGVARVELTFAGERRRLVEVADNVWVHDAESQGPVFPGAVRWLGSSGQELAVAG